MQVFVEGHDQEQRFLSGGAGQSNAHRMKMTCKMWRISSSADICKEMISRD
jgi:hypothetical protein